MPNNDFLNNLLFVNNSYDYPVIKEAFDYLVKSTSIDFKYQPGGCQQRSHLISLILEHQFKINHAKVWLYAPITMIEGDLTALEVKDKYNVTGNPLIHWNYHTAPVIKLNQDGEIIILVIDPVLDAQKPLSLEKWLLAIGNSAVSHLEFTPISNYFFNCKFNDQNILTNIFDGTYFDYSNPAKDNLALEKGLAANDTAMHVYKKYIKPLDNLNKIKDHRLQDLKDIFGNASALDLLIAQNISAGTDNTSYRYVVTHYGEIFYDAKAYFHKRLSYWTLYTNQIL